MSKFGVCFRSRFLFLIIYTSGAKLLIPKPRVWTYLHVSISNYNFLPKFTINMTILILNVSFPFLDGDVPHSTFY